MARKQVILTVVAAASGVLLTAALLAVLETPWNAGRDSSPMLVLERSLPQSLHAPELPEELRLFSGEVDPLTWARLTPKDRGTDIVNMSTRLPEVRFVRNDDKSTEDIVLKPDGEHFAFRQTYFKQQPGEIGRRPHVTQIYAADKDLVLDEWVLRLDTTKEEHTVNSEDGAKSVVGFGKDGQRIIHKLVIAAREKSWLDPVLQSEERWSDDALNVLTYSNIVDPKDNSHTITDWDKDHNPIKVTHTPPYDSVVGTTIRAYYPGTAQLRLEAKVDSGQDTAKYYGPHGKLDHVLKWSQGYLIIEYYDASGTKILLEQSWYVKDKVEHGQTKHMYSISMIKEKDADGNPVRDYSYWNDALGSIDTYNVTVDGVDYGEIDSVYDKDKHTLWRVMYWRGKADHLFDKDEYHTPQENIGLPVVPPDLLKMRVDPEEDNLPIPPPQSSH